MRDSPLLEPAQVQELPALQANFPRPEDLAGELLRRGWLTPYQTEQLLWGRGHELVLGPYVRLDLLGEGGMGQVFRARQRTLGRLVALKILREERLANPDALRRFRREIRAAAQLSHPNIAHALDADQVGGTCFLVLEYVEGADLARLVQQHGPLPVGRACDYIRQAALGLQHAHERGLVHRDVKPANLMVTPHGVVKVLDLGLARLRGAEAHAPTSSALTQEGAVLGTPDYMAPEQARASPSVDIRADIYSLGCTLYYLLTGQPPFPGGTLAQKLLAHQLRQPAPLSSVRPDVPAGLEAVLRKLMAKRPGDRCQAPGEVARALAGPYPGGASDRSDVPTQLLDAAPPAGPPVGREGRWWAVAVLGACCKCRRSCAACARHCLRRLAEGRPGYGEALALSAGCVAVCDAAALAVARHGPTAAGALAGVAAACDACAGACEGGQDDEQLKRCAWACRACARACGAMAQNADLDDTLGTGVGDEPVPG